MKELKYIEETLSDDSKVYAVEIREDDQVIKFDCIDQGDALSFLTILESLLNNRTINDYIIV